MDFIPINKLPEKIGYSANVRGWLHHVRHQGKLIFFVIRDSSGYVQAVAKPKAFNEEDDYSLAQNLTRETAVNATGKIKKDDRAPYNGIELQLSSIRPVINIASPELEYEIRPDSGSQVLADKRHLVLRGERTSDIIRVRDLVTRSLREFFFQRNFTEVTPPTIVQTQVEGGSTLFSFKYFDQEAYLTQSSQLYLETLLPSFENVFCVLPSFRAEKSRTRRHLTEYTHIEAEMAWFEFDDLLEFMEDMIIHVYEFLIPNPLIKKFNLNFQVPIKPFERVSYHKAIELLREFNIKGETGEFLEYGDDITEGPERALVDTINKPTFLTHFPLGMKPFYMKVNAENPKIMNAADLLLPGVGEIIGGSQREDDLERLVAGYKREGLDLNTYYWYTDQRKYGSVPHSGFGLGLERLVQAMLSLEHIRDACLYPRLINRATP